MFGVGRTPALRPALGLPYSSFLAPTLKPLCRALFGCHAEHCSQLALLSLHDGGLHQAASHRLLGVGTAPAAVKMKGLQEAIRHLGNVLDTPLLPLVAVIVNVLQCLPLFIGEIRMPEVDDQDKPILVRIIPCRMNERCVQDDALVFDPGPGLATNRHVTLLWYGEAEVGGEKYVATIAVRVHTGAGRLSRDDDTPHCQWNLTLPQKLHRLREELHVPGNPTAKPLQPEPRPSRAHDVVLHAVRDEQALIILQQIGKLSLDIGQTFLNLLDPLSTNFSGVPPGLRPQARKVLRVDLLQRR
mmetsp:Transcript_47992/g.114070  ORF Transcript_47992/g.114070 Transcript_47992/m.114070 type:complete len:300 (-) Transcript_47992:528-1427(-)